MPERSRFLERLFRHDPKSPLRSEIASKFTPESLERLNVAIKAVPILTHIPDNRILQIDVFGSTANGTANKDSDINFCVRIEDETEFRDEVRLAKTFSDKLKEKDFSVGGDEPMTLSVVLIRNVYFSEKPQNPHMQEIIEEIKRNSIVVLKRKVHTKDLLLKSPGV